MHDVVLGIAVFVIAIVGGLVASAIAAPILSSQISRELNED